MPRLCYVLDLHDDGALIAEYERWHQPAEVWPEVVASLQQAGILQLEIFRSGDRLGMLMEVGEDYDPAAKAARDAADPRIQAWKALMWRFQKPLPGSAPGEKWRQAGRIIALSEAIDAQRRAWVALIRPAGTFSRGREKEVIGAGGDAGRSIALPSPASGTSAFPPPASGKTAFSFSRKREKVPEGRMRERGLRSSRWPPDPPPRTVRPDS